MRTSRLRPLAVVVFASMAFVAPVASAKPAAKTTQVAVPVTAAQLCAVAESTTMFASWGDLNLYSPFQGSTFENGDQGWTWSGGAGIVSGDDDHLLAAGGSHAMQIPSKGSATSPTMCVDSTMPSMRFFIRRTSGTGNLRVTGTLGNGKSAESATLAVVSGSATWAPTAPIVFPSDLLALVGDGSLNVQFEFTADPGTTFRIDDVAMDPYRRT